MTGHTYTIGLRVTMTWTGGTRDGVVVGEEYADGLPTGARFVPVRWADGSRDNVETRVLTVPTGAFAECPDHGEHLYRVPDGWACETCIRDWRGEPLADEDVYLEHDERASGRRDDSGRLALYVVRSDERDADDE